MCSHPVCPKAIQGVEGIERMPGIERHCSRVVGLAADGVRKRRAEIVVLVGVRRRQMAGAWDRDHQRVCHSEVVEERTGWCGGNMRAGM